MTLVGQKYRLVGGDWRYRGVRIRVDKRSPDGTLGRCSIQMLRFTTLDAACGYIDSALSRGIKPGK